MFFFRKIFLKQFPFKKQGAFLCAEKRKVTLRKPKNIYKESKEVKKRDKKHWFSLKNQFILLVEKGKK